MPSTYTSQLRLELMADGENSTTWGQRTNTNLQLVEQAAVGFLNKTGLTGGTVTLTTANGATDEARNFFHKYSGTLVSNATIIWPSVAAWHLVWNNTSGNFSLTCKTSGGTGFIVPQGKIMLLFCDGTDVKETTQYAENLRIDTVDINGGTIDGITLDGGTF